MNIKNYVHYMGFIFYVNQNFYFYRGRKWSMVILLNYIKRNKIT